jgi:hypothetical protein
MSDYQVKLDARNQGLSYRDGSRVYRFNLERAGDTWTVQLPSTGAQFESLVLSDLELATLVPRIERFLSRIWWFGTWPVRYKVLFGGGGTSNPSIQRIASGAR